MSPYVPPMRLIFLSCYSKTIIDLREFHVMFLFIIQISPFSDEENCEEIDLSHIRLLFMRCILV